jgi:hypothetical protein
MPCRRPACTSSSAISCNGPTGAPAFGRAAWRGEPFTWALAPAALPALLSQHRFTLIDGAACDALAEGLRLQGENLVHCRAS